MVNLDYVGKRNGSHLRVNTMPMVPWGCSRLTQTSHLFFQHSFYILGSRQMGSEKRRKIKAERKRPMAEAQGREGPQHGASISISYQQQQA